MNVQFTLVGVICMTAISCAPEPSPYEQMRTVAASCSNSQIPSEERLKTMSSTELRTLAENARIASDLVATQTALQQSVDPCNMELALNQSRLTSLALAKSDAERTQYQIDRVKSKAGR